MKINLKNKQIKFFSNNPSLILAFMLILSIALFCATAFQKSVVIQDGNESFNVITYRGTVDDVLKQVKLQLNQKDKIYPEINTIIKDNDTITIKRAVPIKVIVDGKEMQYLTADETVDELLAGLDIKYGEIDKIYPETDTAIYSDMTVKIVRVTHEEIIETQTLAYDTQIKEMPEWEKGVEKVISNGSDGEKQTTIKITYEDGIEAKRDVVDEKITKSPISYILAIGTLNWKSISRGEDIYFKKMIVMNATSYTNNIACTGKDGGNTATGVKPVRMSDGSKWSTVAVDPRVIPLGTRLWIEGYGYAMAQDVGGGVKGNIIDLYFYDGTDEFYNWRTHKTKVYILE